MDQLYDEVQKSLDGLVISPLQNIINEFLPDRVILTSPDLGIGIDKANPTRVFHASATLVVWYFNRQWYGAYSPKTITGEFVLDFSKFLTHDQEMNLEWIRTATIVHQGETEVIELH